MATDGLLARAARIADWLALLVPVLGVALALIFQW